MTGDDARLNAGTSRRSVLAGIATVSLAGCVDAQPMQSQDETKFDGDEWPPNVEKFAEETEVGDLNGDAYENRWYNRATAAYLQLLHEEQARTNTLLEEIRDELKTE